jgi:hypothetical protein
LAHRSQDRIKIDVLTAAHVLTQNYRGHQCAPHARPTLFIGRERALLVLATVGKALVRDAAELEKVATEQHVKTTHHDVGADAAQDA